MFKPVILITIYRRYHELANHLAEIHKLFHEFAIKPDIIVIWARPILSHQWFFDLLIANSTIQHLIKRPELPLEAFYQGKTTYPESHNLRIGLEYIAAHYDKSNHYAICMAADIQPVAGTFSFVEKKIQNNETNLVIYFLEHNIYRQDIWYTNFFAVKLDKRYWPPISSYDNHDILERQWGLYLADSGLAGIEQTNNFMWSRFKHNNISENMPLLTDIPLINFDGVSFSIKGHKTIWTKIREFFKWLL